MIHPSLSIIESTGPFFAVALLAAVLFWSGTASDRPPAIEAPPSGRFTASVEANGTDAPIKGDAMMDRVAIDRAVLPASDASPSGARLTLTADARFAPPRSRPDSALTASMSADSILMLPGTEAVPPRPNRPSAARVPPPRMTLALPRLSETGAPVTVGPEDGPPALRYFPAGLCSIPFELIQGSLEARRTGAHVEGTVVGMLRRVDVYRPDPSHRCRARTLVPTDPSATRRLSTRFRARSAG